MCLFMKQYYKSKPLHVNIDNTKIHFLAPHVILIVLCDVNVLLILLKIPYAIIYVKRNGVFYVGISNKVLLLFCFFPQEKKVTIHYM